MNTKTEGFKAEIKKRVAEATYGRGVLEALLYYSSIREDVRLPTEEDFIYREVACGVIEYVTGKEAEIPVPRELIPTVSSNYKKKQIFDSLQAVLSEDVLSPRISNALTELLKLAWENYAPPDGGGHWVSTLDTHLRRRICGAIMKSTFSLPYEIILHVQNKVLPTLSESERRDIEAIGRAMRKYINRDLEYIKQHYSW